MPAFDIIRQSRPKETFRVKSIIGKFDLQQSEAVEHFKGSIDLPEKWNIGLIVGHSGTGKSTIANELFGARIIKGFEYTHDNILDDMPQDVEVNEIAKTLTAVGFSSPPSWLKPYHVTPRQRISTKGIGSLCYQTIKESVSAPRLLVLFQRYIKRKVTDTFQQHLIPLWCSIIRTRRNGRLQELVAFKDSLLLLLV